MNQIFGYQILPDGSNNISFDGTQPVLKSTDLDPKSAQVKMFAEPQTHLQNCFSQEYKSCSYVWGIPAHSDIAQKIFRSGARKLLPKNVMTVLKNSWVLLLS